MKSVLRWMAGFFEDQGGVASSKRAGMYISFAMLIVVTLRTLAGVPLNFEMFLTWAGLALTFGGFATAEFFINKGINGNKNEPQA